MSKTLILTIVILLVLLYLYWKYQQKTITLKPEDIIERKPKEVFWDAEDFDLNSDEENNSDHD